MSDEAPLPSHPASGPRGVLLLGATGSIGTAAFDVLRAHADRFHVTGLAARRQGPLLLERARALNAPVIVLTDPEAAEALRADLVPGDPELRVGDDAVLDLVRDPATAIVLQGTSGAAGLPASLAAVKAGKRLALANKESMVVAGPLLRTEAARTGAEIVPVDSEHSAVAQCLAGGRVSEVRRLILTASGGPFRGWPADALEGVTRDDALAHPTWDMGPRITVDSATLMNKALEVIEARWLFDIEPDRIEVVVHPQSIVHSMVEFVDGSVLAQTGPPDMRTPIRYALAWPERLPAEAPRFRLEDYAKLTFEAPDRATFPALDLGFEAARRGGTAGAALNAADEMAVERFLDGALPFTGIAPVCADALRAHPYKADPNLSDLLRVDEWSRTEAQTAC
ncbi:MAG: 1-deoxy-D-xylulose-5-phosphate reductoisomerase [Planctomycetota bacterium]|nr:1-deoxy-D-xylulose-5-phosphate reductoisomerase [Planctomycetota bacterium]